MIDNYASTIDTCQHNGNGRVSDRPVSAARRPYFMFLRKWNGDALITSEKRVVPARR